MIDITTTQVMATQMHPPIVLFAMFFGLALAASLLAGYGMTGSKVRSRFHMLGFALVMAVAVYVILDIEYPRLLGLIRVDAFDQALIDLRESMNRDIQSPGQKYSGRAERRGNEALNKVSVFRVRSDTRHLKPDN